MAFAIVAIVAVGCFVLMDADDSDAATSGSCGENLTWKIDEFGNLTIKGTGPMTDYSPSDVRWGGMSDTVTKVSLPDGLTTIGTNAFRDCTNLYSVTIPGSVTSIGSSAFSGCTLLPSVIIGNSVTSIGESAFYGCTKLSSVTIPDSVTSIGSSAFSGCTKLSSVSIGNSVMSIGESAFYGCTPLSSITIPNSVTSIGSNAFRECTSLAEVNVACTNPLGITKGTEGNGYVAYYATTVNPIIHAYSATYGWADNGSSCTVHIVCANNSEHNHDVIATVNSSEKTPATCTEMGTTTYSVSGTYDGFDYSDSKDVIDIPVKGHAYSATYGWADDGSSCTVHIVCANDSEHNHDVNATVNSSEKTPATCTEMGTTTYSVSGTYDGFDYSDSKDVIDIPVKGHAYSATYGWADDGSSCTVHIVCANDAAHNHDIVAQVASSVKIQPTATTEGTTEYSVSGTYDGFAYSDTKDVQDIPATGGSDSNKKELPITYVALSALAVLAMAVALILLNFRRH